jgi:hypothetical protein
MKIQLKIINTTTQPITKQILIGRIVGIRNAIPEHFNYVLQFSHESKNDWFEPITDDSMIVLPYFDDFAVHSKIMHRNFPRWHSYTSQTVKHQKIYQNLLITPHEDE